LKQAQLFAGEAAIAGLRYQEELFSRADGTLRYSVTFRSMAADQTLSE
jgi:hypothetical protein